MRLKLNQTGCIGGVLVVIGLIIASIIESSWPVVIMLAIFIIEELIRDELK